MSVKRYYPCYLTALFALLTIPRVLHHAMWRDEWQAWLLARYSPHLSDLFHNIRFECYPALWHITLWILSHAGLGARWMQLLHAALAIAVVFVVAHFSPFTTLQKTLFAFGYFPLFEYSILTRCYVLGVLFLLLACHFLFSQRPRPIAFGICLALMANTSAYGLIGAVAMLIAGAHHLIRQLNPRSIAGLSIALAGCIISAIQIYAWRGANLTLTSPLSPSDHAYLALRGPVGAFCPMPMFMDHFWNTTLLDGWQWPMCLTGLALLVLLPLLFFRQRVAMTYLIAASLLYLIMNAMHVGAERHFGYIFFAFVAACWISAARPSTLRSRVFTSLLIVQLITGVTVSLAELRRPFSGARQVASIIQKDFPPDITIVADPDFAAMPVAGYLNRPLYYIGRGQLGSFILDDSARRRDHLTRDDWQKLLPPFLAAKKGDVLLVLNYTLDIYGPGISTVATVPDAIEADETYMVILIKH